MNHIKETGTDLGKNRGNRGNKGNRENRENGNVLITMITEYKWLRKLTAKQHSPIL